MRHLSKWCMALVSAFVCSTVWAADYTWTGNSNDQWNVSNNWDLRNGYYPQSGQDKAIIPAADTARTVVWTTGYIDAAIPSVTIGSNSTLQVDAGDSAHNVVRYDLDGAGARLEFTTNGIADLKTATFTITDGAAVALTSRGALGFGNDVTIDFGTLTQNSYGTFSANPTSGLWGNGHTITLKGSLNVKTLTGSGTIRLASFKNPSDTLTLDISKLTIEERGSVGTDTSAEEYVTEPTWEDWAAGGGRDLVIAYKIKASITATLDASTTWGDIVWDNGADAPGGDDLVEITIAETVDAPITLTMEGEIPLRSLSITSAKQHEVIFDVKSNGSLTVAGSVNFAANIATPIDGVTFGAPTIEANNYWSIEIPAGRELTLPNYSGEGIFRKRGAGVLKMGSEVSKTISITEGTLALGTGDDPVLDNVTLLFEPAEGKAVELTASNWVKIGQGGLAVDVAGGVTIDFGGTIWQGNTFTKRGAGIFKGSFSDNNGAETAPTLHVDGGEIVLRDGAYNDGSVVKNVSGSGKITIGEGKRAVMRSLADTFAGNISIPATSVLDLYINANRGNVNIEGSTTGVSTLNLFVEAHCGLTGGSIENTAIYLKSSEAGVARDLWHEAAGIFAETSDVDIGSDIKLYPKVNVSVRNLTGSGVVSDVTHGSGDGMVAVAPTAECTFDGLFKDGHALTVGGSAPFVLTKASTTVATLTVNPAAELLFKDEGAWGGAMTIATGATLAGAGTITGAVTFADGAILNTTAGASTITGAVTIADGAMVSIEDDTLSAGDILLTAAGLDVAKFKADSLPEGLMLVATETALTVAEIPAPEVVLPPAVEGSEESVSEAAAEAIKEVLPEGVTTVTAVKPAAVTEGGIEPTAKEAMAAVELFSGITEVTADAVDTTQGEAIIAYAFGISDMVLDGDNIKVTVKVTATTGNAAIKEGTTVTLTAGTTSYTNGTLVGDTVTFLIPLADITATTTFTVMASK